MTFAALLSYGGLGIFVLVTLVNGAALGCDLHLLLTGQPTISHRVWAEPRLAVGLVGWQAVGLIGLAVHLAIAPG